MAHRQITTTELKAMLEPHIGLRFSGARNYQAGYDAVDLTRPGHTMVDADIREITDEGVVCFRNHTCTTFRWDEITKVRFNHATLYELIASQTYMVGAEQAVAA
jgi:hypothetical protein